MIYDLSQTAFSVAGSSFRNNLWNVSYYQRNKKQIKCIKTEIGLKRNRYHLKKSKKKSYKSNPKERKEMTE